MRDGFEEPQLKWGAPQGPAAFRIERHERSESEVHAGTASEAFSVSAQGPVFVSYPLANARAIDELTVRLWVKANRPGPQLFAKVVLPRSRDTNGNPLITLIAGTPYTKAGAWQALELIRVPALLESAARGLRVTYGPQVDLREAYIERLVLSLAGGPGTTAVWIDDLQVSGLVEATELSHPAYRSVSSRGDANSTAAGSALERRVAQVRLNGSNLLIGDTPILVRAINHCGEPLEYLRGLGFNAVSLATTITPEIANAAERLNMWVICPPPARDNALPTGESDRADVLGRAYDRVIVWNLGSGLCHQNLEEVKQQAESIRVRDRELARPLLCEPLTDLRAFSRSADILLLSRLPIGSTLELPKYLTWLRDRPRLARSGTPIWATIQTEMPFELLAQMRGLSAGRVGEVPIQTEQIRLLAHTAIAGGARGLVFESRSRLDAPTATARLRSRAVQLLNLELSIAEPWIASGSFMTMIPGSDPESLAAVFESSHSKMLLPLWSGKGAQFVPGQLSGNNIAFVVPGVPESFNAYELTPADLPLPRHKRVAGGTRITLDEAGLSSIVLLTGEPTSAAHVLQKLNGISPEAARIQRELAASRLELVTEIDRRLVAQSHVVPKAAEYINTARAQLAECDAQLSARQFQAAYLAAERAIRPLRLIERRHWEATTKDLPSMAISPFIGSFATLPEHPVFLAMVNQVHFVPAELVGGDFEQMQVLESTGWRNMHYEQPAVKIGAELSSKSPRFGRFSLRLWAQASDPLQPPEVLETPPVWIESAPVQLRAGELVRIRGWVRVGKVTGSVDGLMVIDSIGGQALAERIEETADWKQFTLYRVTPETGPCTVKFALTGLGEAWIDEVTVERVIRPSDMVRPRLPVASAGPRLDSGIIPPPGGAAPDGGTGSQIGSMMGLSIRR